MDNSALWTTLREELALQQECLDMMNAAWLGDYRSRGGMIYCGRGCHGCCSLTVNCTVTEAVALAEALDERQRAAVDAYAVRLRDLMSTVTDVKEYLQMQRREMGMCPLLDESGSCGCYAPRPLTCRALLSTKESYWCAVDFATLSAGEKEQYRTSLDSAVTAFPLHYAASPQETGRDFETRQLKHMEELLGYSCYGCMPVLVHLVQNYGLDNAPSREAAQRLVEDAGFADPLLVSWLP